MVPRRILLLITDLKIGGTPTVVREVAVRLHHPPDVLVHVACLDSWGPVADQIHEAGVPTTAFGARGAADVRVVGRLVALLRREKIDTVLSFLVHANAVAAVASRVCRGVRFLQSIQTTQARPRWHWRVQRVAQRAADAILVPSRSVAAAARDWSGIPENKIVVIPNAIDVNDFKTSLHGAQGGMPGRGRQGGPPHRVVFIGRLDPIKRLPDLLVAIAHLRGFARLDVYGEGGEHQAIERRIAALGIGHLVSLHGSIPRPQPALENAEVLVLPSEAEGFGLVLIEGMAAGVPIVATDAPGIRDVVRHGITGILVPIGSPEALAVAIQKVIEDRELRQSLIAAGSEEVRARFTWDKVTNEYRRVLAIWQTSDIVRNPQQLVDFGPSGP